MGRTNPSIEIDYAEAEAGPKMQLCSPMERRFVWEYVRLGATDRVGAEAVRAAGYSQHEGTSRVRAHYLLQRERVLEALDEVGRKSFRSLLVPAVAAIGRLIEKADHPDHLKAVLGTLSRLGLVERSGVEVNVSGMVTINHTDEAIETLRVLKQMLVPRSKLEEMFGHSGLSRYEGMLAELERKNPHPERLSKDSRETKLIEHEVNDE